jgi:hypothetical protein
MGEANANAEIAHHLSEHGEQRQKERRHEAVEILEAVLLSLVAVLTAWSGYQAARWDGDSARDYATASRLRIESDQYFARSGQTLDYNAGTFNTWLEATVRGENKLAALMVKRFTPEYRSAFKAWLALDPLHDPKAPPGPRYMPEYKDPLADKSAELSKQSSEAFAGGVHAREKGEKYVRATVILATVLFLIALGQRFDVRGVRYGLICVSGILLAYGVVLIMTLPRA